MAEDLGSQLKVQQEINKVLQSRTALIDRQNAQLGGQADL